MEKLTFTASTFQSVLRKLESADDSLRIHIGDKGVIGRQAGLRAIAQKGRVSFVVAYDFRGSRPFHKIGEWPEMDIATARAVAEEIREIAAKGVDPTKDRRNFFPQGSAN